VLEEIQGCIRCHQINVIICPHVKTDTGLYTGSPEQRNYRPTCLDRYKAVYIVTPDTWAYNYVVLVTPYTTLYLSRHVDLWLRCSGDPVFSLVSDPTRGPLLTLFWSPCIQPCICPDTWAYNYVVLGQTQGCIQGHQNNVTICSHVWTDTKLYTGSPEQRNYRPTYMDRYKVVCL
jgi:cytochrome c551/c552